MAVTQPRSTHILYQCAKFADDRQHLTSFLTCATFNMYFSAISRYIDLKFIQDTYRVVVNSPNNFDLHRSKSQGRYIAFEGTVISQKTKQ